jgi:hypothetical protein
MMSSGSLGLGSITGSAVDCAAWAKDPVSIQVSWPEGFFTGLLNHQIRPAMSRTWIVATMTKARLKRGS